MPSLVAVLANPPLGTSGSRTLARVALAAELLSADEWSVVNLLDEPTFDVRGISSAGATEPSWLRSRGFVDVALAPGTVVLAAWGVSAPNGMARHFHRRQVEWVQTTCSERRLNVLAVGKRARHPSRWQRHTAQNYPGVSFREAVARSLGPLDLSGGPHLLGHPVAVRARSAVTDTIST